MCIIKIIKGMELTIIAIILYLIWIILFVYLNSISKELKKRNELQEQTNHFLKMLVEKK